MLKYLVTIGSLKEFRSFQIEFESIAKAIQKVNKTLNKQREVIISITLIGEAK